MPKENKCTSVEKDKRVLEVSKLLLQGYGVNDIFRYVSENFKWKLTKRTIENYVSSAKKEIQSLDYSDAVYQLNYSLSQLDDLIKINHEEKDYREVRHCIKQKADLLGLVENKNITNNLQININPVTINIAEDEPD